MAPTCYNTTMKNLHYRTQSLPESVYQHQMLHLTQHGAGADYHHSLHGHHGLGNPLVSHHQAHIKKRNALRRSQTSVCDLLQSSLAHHRPSPLTAGLYEQFLPPPNFNAIGLPVSRAGHRVSRAQSFYVPGSQAGHHYSMARHEAQAQAAHHYNNSVYSCDQAQAASWYRGSVPNLPQSSYPAPAPPQKNVTTPLFVDCSVEYDLGEQPVIPKDSEPLLTIHPEYVNKCRSVPASPYTRPKPIIESHKSLPDIGDKSQAKLLARHMRSSPRAAARFAMNTQKQAEEAGRKLSVESRDSGIGGMTGGWGSSVSMYPGCDMNMMTPSSAPFMTSGYPAQTSEFCGGKVLPTSASKRFALSELVSGLLCCSAPPYNAQEWRGQAGQAGQAPGNSVISQNSQNSDPRTLEWVMSGHTPSSANQRPAFELLTNQRPRCRRGQCGGQDCGDGFCVNVWNSLVHV